MPASRNGRSTSLATCLSPTQTPSKRFALTSTAMPPSVRLSSPSATQMSSSTYWHGKLSDAWASEWVSYFTGGKGQFATTAMEDTGTMQSLKYLAQAGRVDCQRILVLRTVSNFDQQPRGMTAAESLAQQRIGTYSAYLPSLEAAYESARSRECVAIPLAEISCHSETGGHIEAQHHHVCNHPGVCGGLHMECLPLAVDSPTHHRLYDRRHRLGFLLVARIQLGRSFSVTAKASHLVTTGLYSRVRNPIYVFSALFILGLIIWTGRPWLLLIFAVLIPLQIFRSRKESQVLEAKFGQAYIDYKAKTWI